MTFWEWMYIIIVIPFILMELAMIVLFIAILIDEVKESKKGDNRNVHKDGK